MFKNIVKHLVGEKALGWLDYFRSSRVDRDWSGPFNGQQCRQKIFIEISREIPIAYIVETGTFRGVTTEYFASKVEVPVFSIESNPRNYGFALARLRRLRRRVKQYLGDSVSVLKNLFEHKALPDGTGFFYLDAHWFRHLPLREEVFLVFENRPESVVMIDDFEVPGDSGYLFDDYGESGSLTLDYLSGTIASLNLVGFFPSCTSDEETGKKRGTLILAGETMAGRLRDLKQIREHK